MILIAFAGKLGSGKTTAAQILVNFHGFKRVSFAAPLYDMLEAGGFGRPKTLEEKMTPMPMLLALGVEPERATWRHAAQTLGTEWGRRCLSENIWAALALARCNDPDGKYVIDDCRFENEAALLRACGGKVVHIVGRKVDAGVAGGHESEKGLLFYPDTDSLLENNEGLSELESKVWDLVK